MDHSVRLSAGIYEYAATQAGLNLLAVRFQSQMTEQSRSYLSQMYRKPRRRL